MDSKPYIVWIGKCKTSGEYFSIAKGGGNSICYWWSRKHGWLPAHRQNVKFYSRFRTRAAAEAELKKIGA